ncbi:MAG TPA: PH domain-containing protein [Actinomycetes bacterium]
MGYPSKLLTQGEKIEFEMRPHWRSMVVPSLVLVVTVGAASYLVAVTPDGGAQKVLRWIILAVALLVVVWWFVRPLLTWLTTQYVFTSRRIITRTGVIARSGKDMSLSKLNDVSFTYTIFERILGCGTLTVSSAAEDGELVIRNLPKVEEIQREIYRLSEADAERRRNSGSDDQSS